MPLTKPSQQLHLDLKEAAAILKWSGVDLMRMAVRLSEEGFESYSREILTILSGFPDAEDKLVGYADEVKAGLVVRDLSKPSK
ncbi:hypothetical protein [Pseudomonas sp. PSPC2-3]|uniref:hypothetical protein n=1 Tax=Pseudomonas sp. PSPC2-3 TaxID=2804561 RepID=UPI00206EA7B7|nr:MAG TPA: hypothetical protein [Caudoviricetes sp.]